MELQFVQKYAVIFIICLGLWISLVGAMPKHPYNDAQDYSNEDTEDDRRLLKCLATCESQEHHDFKKRKVMCMTDKEGRREVGGKCLFDCMDWTIDKSQADCFCHACLGFHECDNKRKDTQIRKDYCEANYCSGKNKFTGDPKPPCYSF